MNLMRKQMMTIILAAMFLTLSCVQRAEYVNTIDSSVKAIVGEFKKQIESGKYGYDKYYIAVQPFQYYLAEETEPDDKPLLYYTVKRMFFEELSKQFMENDNVRIFDPGKYSDLTENFVLNVALTRLESSFLIQAYLKNIEKEEIVSSVSHTLSHNKIDKRYIKDLKIMEPHVYQSIKSDIEKISWVVEGDTVALVKGNDQNGYTSKFKIVIMAKEFEWPFEGTDIRDIVRNTEFGYSESLTHHLSKQSVIRHMIDAKDIICIGTASCEHLDFRVEEKRAFTRSVELASEVLRILSEVTDFSKIPHIYTVNLGLNIRSCDYQDTGRTAFQRRPIIIGVMEKDDNVNLKEALYEAFNKISTSDIVSGFHLTDYSCAPKSSFAVMPFSITGGVTASIGYDLEKPKYKADVLTGVIGSYKIRQGKAGNGKIMEIRK